MIIKSRQKIDSEGNIKIENEDGTFHLLERKDRIKYLGVLLDETVSFKHHISHVCTRISRNNGTLAKLRHFLTLSQMKQLYCSIIFPCISYAIFAWGSAYKTHIDKVQSKQNHSIRLIFFARTFGEQTDSALLLLNLLDVLTVTNVYRLQALKFTHSWHKGLLPSLFHDFFRYASEVHGYHTRYASRQNLYISKVGTDSGEQTIVYTATILWDNILTHLEDLNTFNFLKHLKLYLLSEQHSENK